MNTDGETVDKVLVALANPARRGILNEIAAKGQVTATTLADRVTISRQAVVKHLDVLKDAGLVTGRHIGREVRYSVLPEQLAVTAAWMKDLSRQWDRRLVSIKRLAEGKKD